MKRLGEILLEKGAIAVSELHTGLESCRHTGGRLGTQLLKFGFVDEHALLEALSEQLGVPAVADAVLRRSPVEVRKRLPLDVARRLQAVPYKLDKNVIWVAFTNPGNPSAIEEVNGFTGLRVRPFVATEVGVMAALDGLAQEFVEEARMESVATPEAASDGWNRLWATPRPSADALLRAGGRSARGPDVMAATFPELVPVPERAVAESGAVDEAEFVEMLDGAAHRDDVAGALIRRGAAVLGRCCLFAVHTGRVIGWMARGSGIAVEDVQSYSISLDLPSIFADIFASDSFAGPMPPGPLNDELLRVMGDPTPSEVVIMPIRVKQRVIAYLVGDNPEEKVAEGIRELVTMACQKAGIAFEIVILRKKIRS